MATDPEPPPGEPSDTAGATDREPTAGRAETPGPGGRGAGPSGGGAHAPPLRIPAEHFAAALVFLVAGAAAMAWRSGALAAGAFSDPGVVAGTHLFTLGWISTAIMGVVHHLLPVALEAPLRWPRAADLTFVAWTGGVAVFTVGMATATPAPRSAGAGLLGLASLAFAVNVAATLRGAGRRGLTWWCMAGAVVSLVGGWLLGFLLTVNLATGVLGPSRFPVLAVHVHVAAGGWVLLSMIGVAHHLHPMVLGSRGASDLPGAIAAVLAAAGTAALLLSGHLLPAGVLEPAFVLLAGGAGAFVLQEGIRFRRRRRPGIEPAMALVAASLALLAAAVAAGLAALAGTRPAPRLLTAYGVLLIPGGLGLFVAGHYYRIVPSIAWLHRFRPVAGGRDVPGLLELFDHRVAYGAAALLAGGVTVAAGGVLAGSPGLVRAGALAFAAGALTLCAQVVGIGRRRP